MFDPTITIGNIIEIGTILSGGVVAVILLRQTVYQLRAEVGELKVDVKALNKVVVELAVTDRRLLSVEEDIRELRHGRGFVRGAIEGEWPRVGT